MKSVTDTTYPDRQKTRMLNPGVTSTSRDRARVTMGQWNYPHPLSLWTTESAMRIKASAETRAMGPPLTHSRLSCSETTGKAARIIMTFLERELLSNNQKLEKDE